MAAKQGKYIVRVTVRTSDPVRKKDVRTFVQDCLDMRQDLTIADGKNVVSATASGVDEQ